LKELEEMKRKEDVWELRIQIFSPRDFFQQTTAKRSALQGNPIREIKT
jgi:hypothetical protein